MLEKYLWNEIHSKISEYKYASIQSCDYDDLSNAVLMKNDRECIILIDKSVSPHLLFVFGTG